MIILNEKEYAEQCIKNKTLGEKPYLTLSILAKYYYNCFGYRKKKIVELLTSFMSSYYPRYSYNRADWDSTIEKIAANAGKRTLYEIDGVWITKAELETIEAIENKVLERLAFTLLCLAKLGNLKNPTNNNWVNMDAKDIFAMARISCSVVDRYKRLSQLYQLGLLEFPKKNDNLSCRVKYVTDDSDKVFLVSDFRELSYEYLKYKGGRFVRCCECGILVRNNKAGTVRYCSECAGYIPQKIKYLICTDCGEEFEIDAKNNNSCRCKPCQIIRDREMTRLRVQKHRENHAM